MSADTITMERLESLAIIARLAADAIEGIRLQTRDGKITPEEAAAEINEILANLNAANQ
jgi:hypothetical protein